MAKERAWILSGGVVFAFDTVISESHNQEMALPDDPLETGVTVSDHAYLKAATLDVVGIVSDIAFRPNTFASSTTSRSVTAFDLMLKLQASMEPFQVQTGLRLYQNMQIASLGADQNARTGSALLFRASLKQLNFLDTRTVTFPPRQSGKATRTASPKVNGGQKSAAPVTDPQRGTSILKSMGASNATATNIVNNLLGINLQQPAQ